MPSADREAIYVGVGKEHQDCLAHYFRELLEVIRMEPDKTWAQDVADLLVEMMWPLTEWLAIAKETGQDPVGPTTKQAEKWRHRLLDALAKGDAQYKATPPTKYFLEGYTLRQVLSDRIENVLPFTRKPWIPNTNNECARHCKTFKRAQHQAVTFRASEYLDYLCDFVTITATQVLWGESVYQKLLEIMSRIAYIPKAS